MRGKPYVLGGVTSSAVQHSHWERRKETGLVHCPHPYATASRHTACNRNVNVPTSYPVLLECSTAPTTEQSWPPPHPFSNRLQGWPGSGSEACAEWGQAAGTIAHVQPHRGTLTYITVGLLAAQEPHNVACRQLSFQKGNALSSLQIVKPFFGSFYECQFLKCFKWSTQIISTWNISTQISAGILQIQVPHYYH